MATLTNNGICRCCASEGTFKDVRSVYVWMGEEEIYADMLKECFDITLSAQEGLSGVCEVCVTQLRNARNFKRQVLDIEDRFRRHLFDDLLNRECTPAPHSLLVKMEVQAEGHSESEPDDVDDEDYTPEFKEVPVIKREASEEPKAKRRAKTTAKKKEGTKRARQPRKSVLWIDPRNEVSLVNKEKLSIKMKTQQIVLIKKKSEVNKHQSNIRTALLNSNATPIKCRGSVGYVCDFCGEEHPEAADLKAHTITAHDEKTISKYQSKATMRAYMVKLDITSLKCKICLQNFEDLDPLMDHLADAHNKIIHKDIKSHILPFKFDSDPLKCVHCSIEFTNFKLLLEHMNTHYRNHICDVCGGGFVNRRIMQAHRYRHKKGVFFCAFCSKEYDTKIKAKDHERAFHASSNNSMVKRYRCGYCGEKFSDYRKKKAHEVKAHGAKATVFSCQACGKTYDSRKSLTAHTKTYHLMERNAPK